MSPPPKAHMMQCAKIPASPPRHHKHDGRAVELSFAMQASRPPHSQHNVHPRPSLASRCRRYGGDPSRAGPPPQDRPQADASPTSFPQQLWHPPVERKEEEGILRGAAVAPKSHSRLSLPHPRSSGPWRPRNLGRGTSALSLKGLTTSTQSSSLS